MYVGEQTEANGVSAGAKAAWPLDPFSWMDNYSVLSTEVCF
jgi:hypothetical protein